MAERALSEHHTFFATCPRNTEGLLLAELRALGATDAVETRAGVAFAGAIASVYRACLWSRIASRVLIRLTAFPVATVDDLYEGTSNIDWEDHLDARGTLAVEVTSTVRLGPLAQLNTHFAEQRVKDAIVDRFRTRTGARPGVDLARPDVRVNVHLTPAEAIISLDLSGDGLHRRGYRLGAGDAPLKENLAAAILMRAGWPHIAGGGALVDPLCGSGTLLIEGALMAGDVAPGLLREYWGFLGWKGFVPSDWHPLVQEAGERRERGLDGLPAIRGFDHDARAVASARANARRAGLAGRILVEQRGLSALSAPRGKNASRGLVVANPPYGKRLGEIPELIEVYETLGERLKASFSGWEAAVFTGNPELGAHLGLRVHRSNVLFNGPLQCRLLQFHIDPLAYRTQASHRNRLNRTPLSAETADEALGKRGALATAGARAVAGAQAATDTEPAADARVQADTGATMFANRLRKNFRHLRRWAAREGVHCYRLYDADLPEYSAAIDVYHDWALVQEYAPPDTVDPVRARRRLKEMLAAIPRVIEIPPQHVVLKNRRPQRGADQYQRLGDTGHLLEVEEGSLRFLVNLTDYLDTGLFLDHRPTRALIRESASGRRFLNLFAYTGSATVYAAAGGALSTTTVDLSLRYLEWARRNLELNGFSGPEHGFVRADCMEWLTLANAAHRDGNARAGAGPYDLIFLDAPTFSNSKSMSGTLDIQRDHPELIRLASGLLSPLGTLLFSTNFRRFKLDPGVTEAYDAIDITKQTIPPDFSRNPRIHSCFRISRAHHPNQAGTQRANRH